MSRPRKRPAANGSDGGGIGDQPPASQGSAPAKRPASASARPVQVPHLLPEASDSLLASFFKQVLKQCAKRLIKHIGENIVKRDFLMTSACTGSGMAEVAHAELHKLFNKGGYALFSCEKTKFKRQFYQHTVEPMLAEPGCCFEELGELGTGIARCAAHETHCEVSAKGDIFVCGFSCKDFSRLSGTFTADQRRQVLEQGLGSSGKTFRDVRRHLSYARPRTFILENVDAFGDGDDDNEDLTMMPNVEFLYASLEDLGYSLSHRVLLSTNFGLPQRRRRAYFVGIHGAKHQLTKDAADQLSRDIFQSVAKLDIPMRPMAEFILKHSDPHVIAEVERAELAKQNEPPGMDSCWPDVHSEFFQGKGISISDLRVPPHLQSNRWFNMLPCRTKDIVLFGYYSKAEAPGLLNTVDASQTIHRTAKGYNGVMQTLTPRSQTWLYAVDGSDADAERCERLLLGYEALGLQGFPLGWIDATPAGLRASDPQLRDLAGNAFSATVFGVTYAMLLAHVPAPVETLEREASVDELMALMAADD